MNLISGIVTKGKQRGKELGFPTANILLPVAIDEGIYISHTIINNALFPSLTFIGASKTFNETKFQAETYILNFDRDLYGEEIRIELIKKIRNNKKFSSSDELIEQMNRDKMEAEEYFNENK